MGFVNGFTARALRIELKSISQFPRPMRQVKYHAHLLSYHSETAFPDTQPIRVLESTVTKPQIHHPAYKKNLSRHRAADRGVCLSSGILL